MTKTGLILWFIALVCTIAMYSADNDIIFAIAFVIAILCIYSIQKWGFKHFE